MLKLNDSFVTNSQSERLFDGLFNNNLLVILSVEI
jgi:hypothetical protein